MNGKKGKVKLDAENSIKKHKRRGHPPTNGFSVGNPWRFKSGQSGNPGGRPKLLSDAYREWLSAENEDGITNAALVAQSTGTLAAMGDIQSAKELRQATEGDLIKDLSHMTDAELDDFIAQRERTEISGVSGEGTPAKAESTD